MITALQTVLKQETKEYKIMLAIAQEKKDVLVRNDVVGLDRIVGREGALLKKIKQLETEREKLIAQIAALCRMPKETLRIEHIIEVLKGDTRDAFISIREELACVLSELSSVNLINKGLIETHLSYSDFCVNLLTGHINSTLSTYSHSGAAAKMAQRGHRLLDQTV